MTTPERGKVANALAPPVANDSITQPTVMDETQSLRPETRARKPSRARRFAAVAKDVGIRVGVLLAAGAIWELVAVLIDTPFFPPLTSILHNAWLQWFSTAEGFQSFREMLGASFARLIPGLAYGIVAGIILGVLLARVKWVEELLSPLVQFLRAIPAAAKIPLFIAILGLTDVSKISVIALGVALPFAMHVADGVKNTEPVLIAMAKVYRVGRFERLWGIILPAAAPQAFAGLRIGTTIAILVLVLSELTGAFTGIGQYVQYASSQFKPLDMWAGVLVLGALGYTLNLILNLLEHKALLWQRESTSTTK